MTFAVGFAAGLALGIAWYKYLFLDRYEKSEVLCNEKEKDREIQTQLENLISYGNDRQVKR